MITFVMTSSGLNVFGGGKSFSITPEHANFEAIKSKCLDTSSTFEDVRELIDLKVAIETFMGGKISIEGEKVKYQSRELSSSLAKRILNIIREDKSFEGMPSFLQNLFENPSYRAVNELYGFLEACSLPITSDGCFLAYKKVRHDYKDLHSKTFDNIVGKTCKMARNEVDEDKNRTCSSGLHVCSFEYLKNYGGTGTGDLDDRVVICKINPRDVVSVPSDYDNQKMRVCEYVVVDEIPNDGITKIVDWCYGKRNEGWIRDTLKIIRNLILDLFKFEDEAKYNEDLYKRDEVTAKLALDLIEKICVTCSLSVHSDKYFSVYGDELSIKNLLQFVSNWAE